MLMLMVEAVGILTCQVAVLLVSAAVEPFTTAVLPTKPSAWVDCAVCCKETSVPSEALVLSCCWTPANSTSCWVNWLVSSGSSGFWFCNCVVSSCRKLWKLPAICCEAIALVAAAEDVVEEPAGGVVVPETIGEGVLAAAVVVMAVSSNADVYAAAGSEHPAVASSHRCGGGGILGRDHQPLGVAIGIVAAVLAGRLVAQAELQAAVAGLEAGIVEGLLQLRGVLLQHRKRFRLLDHQMRGHLAARVDADANVDAAEIGGIEPDLEIALAVPGGGRDLDRKPAQRHRGARRRRGGQRPRGGEACRRRGRKLRRERACGLQIGVSGSRGRTIAGCRRGTIVRRHGGRRCRLRIGGAGGIHGCSGAVGGGLFAGCGGLRRGGRG